MIFGSELQCPCRYLLLPAFPVGFLIVTAAADKGLVDIHDRRPLVLVPDAAREWMKQGSPQKTESMVTPVFATPILTTSWLA